MRSRRPYSVRRTLLQGVLLAWWLAASVGAAESPDAPHWAFQPIQRPALPSRGNPIDALVLSRLQAQGLTPNPPASAAALIRRITFDLTGLPPTPEEVDAFVQDPAPDRFERVVERLLASPRYGERWGRHWLDIVRFTESQGFEYDRLRDHAWPYRDYVIDSFNTDRPYDRFLQEQIAGDVLEPVTSEGIIAAGLLVAGPWDQAGNSQANVTQRAITREEEMEDLVSVVGQTFLGLTVNCARCHDHKFDPIPLADYYRVKAVFDGVKHGERAVEGAAEVAAREARRQAAQQTLAAAQAEVTALESEGVRRVAARQPQGAREPGPTPLTRWKFEDPSAGAAAGEAHGGAAVSGGALRLPQPGAYFEAPLLTQDIREKTLEAWVAVADLEQGGGAAISLEQTGRGPFDALVFGERQARKWMAGSEGFVRTRDLDASAEDAPPGSWVQLVAVYSGDNRIALYRNGVPYGKPYDPSSPLLTFRAGKARIVLGRRHEGGGRPWLTGAVQQAALYDRALSPAEVAAAFRSGGFSVGTAEMLAALSPEERKARETALARVAGARESLAAASRPGRMAYAGTRVQPEPTRALKRGDVKSPADVVSPAGLSVVKTVASDLGLKPDAPEAQRRLKFAQWLADPRNPLPARVMANRVWQFHFGQGLVATPSDFGKSGARPSHPELLDWLASEFIASGWSVKALHRQIVSSATYRQSADFQPAAAKVDADNQWLWRYPPRRLEAEAVRDAMLAVSGQLNPRVGGPSFRPFTTSEYGAMFYHLVDKDDPEFNRRTVYRMNINSGKEPLLDALDCPDPSVKTPRRGVTTTPLQALGLMNGSFVQRQAARLADRAWHQAGQDPARAVETAYRLALSRLPCPEESQQAQAVVRQRGLVHVCWALLNATEFVYVR
jgi:hypothetical protein